EIRIVRTATPARASATSGAASLIFLHTLLTIHYAHYFYGGADEEGGLKFPDGIEEPGYWDFLYFSFTISVAAQTADVA
ncbi:DUF1345 domain-containing protein, partial [Rhizobium leguminosarum]|uniref:DUF1345 domain-containing protein n=1 Tax=Rhizobium leguminosarum TaxID=384 RepID=UPI003F9C51E2